VGVAKRKIIEIDRELCDGCGLCTSACDEGALELDSDRKAVLVREIYCDGMGVCLNVCPTGALEIVERESPEYEVEATRDHVLSTRGRGAVTRVHGVREAAGAVAGAGAGRALDAPSELTQWPVQLQLVSPQAPYFNGADLLVAADCTAFARGSFHSDLLKGRKLVVACPKLDDTAGYVEKLAEIIRLNDLRSLTVAIMTVPCCTGLLRTVQQAVSASGVDIPIETVVIAPSGELVT
jgi:NAD-dependent dihydropyrimidine dehydrogenase PreA subunit